MKINNCSKCNVQPKSQSDELGIAYRLICPKCSKCTHDIISKSSTLGNPYLDDETLTRLTNEWNSMN